MKIAVIVGSLHQESSNARLARAIEKLAPTDFTFKHSLISDLPLYNQDGLPLLFIVGDILGVGIYALTGQVAKHVGGIAWLLSSSPSGSPIMMAFNYLELVTKYPNREVHLLLGKR